MDIQSLWESAQLEISLEGCNGCTLERLWKLVKLDDKGDGGEEDAPGASAASKSGDEVDPRDFLKAWLWRYLLL